jgi:hypothetical protein
MRTDAVTRPAAPRGRRPGGAALTLVVFAATLVQLVVATVATDLPQFAGKAFGARLLAYPLLMLLVPAAWWLRARGRGAVRAGDAPWTAFTLVMAPFLVDVTGNTLNLYDTVAWWDDANHFANWALLCGGLGLLLLRTGMAADRLFALLLTGIGGLLAMGWELGEWYTFIRHGTEIETAYQDTLADQTLGTLGGALAAVVLVWRGRREGPRPRAG